MSLDAATSSRMQAALEEVRAAAAEAQRLVGELAWWTPSSVAAGVKSAAHSTQVGLDALQVKYDRWSDPASPAPSESDLYVFFDGAAELANNAALRQVVQLNTTTEAVQTVAADTVTDVKRVATAAFLWGTPVVVFIVVVVFWVWWAPLRRAVRR